MPTVTEPAPRNPRKRITLACNGCRAKRTKCDGSQPSCSACSYREQDCEYTQAESKRKRPSNAYIMALEARVASLEKRLALALGTTGASPPEDVGDYCEHEETIVVPADLSIIPAPSDETNEEPVDELADALGCFTLGDAGELRFFGASSNFDIIQNHTLKVPSSIEARNRGIAVAQLSPGYFEPSDELRDHLLGLFWKWQNSWQYIVPRESFVQDLYVEKSGRFCTPLLLNTILALSSRYSSRLELRADPDDANTAGEAFATQAKIMLHCEYEAPTTSTVQATALLGLFFASIDNEGLGFMYIGMATRMAMNLGLQSDCTAYAAKGLVSEEDVEARNVAFWGIYVLDKLYCLGMGRPASIQEYNITTTKPKGKFQPVLFLTEEQARISQPFTTSHINENAMYTCEIMIITSEVIDQLYAQQSSWTYREREERVMKTHLQAVKFFDKLPKSLKISESSLQPSAPYVYQLHLQYHHSIILIHRPFFKALHRGHNSVEYDPEGKDIHSRFCKVSAVKISRILRIYRNNYTNRCMPISAVHPTFTAAIILLLDVKASGSSGSSESMRCLCICIKALYEMNTNWDWANRSVRAIRSLAAQWEVELCPSLAEELSQENLHQFELYERGCLPHSHGQPSGEDPSAAGGADQQQQQQQQQQNHHAFPAEAFDDIFGAAWTYDQSLTNLAFNFFDEN